MSVLSLLRPLTPFGGGQVVAARELDPGDVLDHVHQLIDGHLLAAPEVDRVGCSSLARMAWVPLRQSSM